MIYSLGFFNTLLWISLIGLVVVFGFQIWYYAAEFKNKN